MNLTRIESISLKQLNMKKYCYCKMAHFILVQTNSLFHSVRVYIPDAVLALWCIYCTYVWYPDIPFITLSYLGEITFIGQ